jgi:hypothetical protein
LENVGCSLAESNLATRLQTKLLPKTDVDDLIIFALLDQTAQFLVIAQFIGLQKRMPTR